MRVVVYHPENVRRADRMNLQTISIQNIRRLQRETTVSVALETFGGSRVVMMPEEIRDLKYPMVLDTSHLFPSRTYEMIDTYASGIAVLHLSEPPSLPSHTTHMPVGPVCREALTRLRAKEWAGIVTLEYLPEYGELLRDRQMVEQEFGG